MQKLKQNNNVSSSYSQIIPPEEYNKLMSMEHLYIHLADRYIANSIQEKTQAIEKAEVIEIGCGPARILPLIFNINPTISLTGLDVDPVFIEYAKKCVQDKPIKIIESSILTYSHPHPVDIFYSEGFHHHIEKGENVQTYLQVVHNLLKEGGYYIVGDEFITEYKDEDERDIKLVLWYSHIIANALKKGFHYLAREEAKTLLDDIYESKSQNFFKTEEQIQNVLEQAPNIDRLGANNIEEATNHVIRVLKNLKDLSCLTATGDDTIALSRGDYKISPSVFKQEVEKAGFEVESFRSFGPLETVGSMVVYILKKI